MQLKNKVINSSNFKKIKGGNGGGGNGVEPPVAQRAQFVPLESGSSDNGVESLKP